MNNKTLSILHIGNSNFINKDDCIDKSRFSICKLFTVRTFQEYKDNLKVIRPDIILVEYDAETSITSNVLGDLAEQRLKIPTISLIKPELEEAALNLINEGLSDYLFSDNLKRLPNSIRQLADKYRLQRQNDQRYQYLYDQNLAGLYTSSVKGVLLYCNVAFANMLGFDHPEELIGQHVSDLHQAVSDRNQFIENLRKHRKVYNYENTVVRKDGKTVYLLENIYLAVDELSGDEVCQGITIDVTQLVLTKQNITRARAMLAEAQKLAGMGNWNYNMRKKEFTISAGMCDVFGLSKTEQPNVQEFLGMIHKADRDKVLADLMNLKQHGGKTRNNFKIVLKEGKVITVAAVHTLDLDETGEVLRYYGVMQDITALESAERERDKITEELVKRNQALEQFTYVISHNLRAPVANIKALIEIIDHPDDDQEGKEMIEKMSLSVANLDTIITDLNLILQVKQDKNTARETIDFNTIITSIQLSIKNLIVQENVEFELDLSCTSSIVTVRSYLYSIFYNLTLNSIKYRNPDISPIIKISCTEEEDVVVIQFSDNGKGIDLEKNGDQLFGLYKRFDSTIDGKGLGLYMVKAQVEELGGTIDVESAPLMGTKFTIRLPGQ